MKLKKQRQTSIITFKQWRRKGYSLFSVLKQTVKISVLSVVYFSAVPVLSFATEQDTVTTKMEFDIDEIEVSAERAPALFSQVARILTVISSKEIEAAPVQSVTDLLEYVAGVDVRQRGAEGVQSDVSIRGGTFDQMLILLNGINITDPQTGHHNFNLPVSLSQVERIEILEGPAARVYGPNAFSGAINIITKQPGENKIDIEVAGGSFGFVNTNLSGSFKTGRLQHMVASNLKQSDGYIENTDFKTLNLFYSGQLKTTSGSLKFQSGYSNKGFGANSFYTPKFPNQYEAIKTMFTSVKYESAGKIHLTPVFYWRRKRDRFELFRDNPASWYKKHNHHLTNVFGVSANSWFLWRGGKTSVGAEFRSENILSNVLGNDLDTPQKVPGEDAEFTKSAYRNTFSVFAEHSVIIGRWSFTAGVMSNYISHKGGAVNFSPGVDMSCEFTPGVKFFGSFNTSLRMPTFTDLYYSGPVNTGNENLKPEESATVEGGIKVNKSFVRGHFVVFYRHGKNIIDWVKTNSEDIWQPQNLTELNSLGAEVQVNVFLKQLFGNCFPDKLDFSYLNNNLVKNEAGFISNYVLDNLKHKFVAVLNKSFFNKLTLNFSTVYQKRNGTYTEYVNNNFGLEKEFSPFWLFDAKAEYIINNLRIFISASNIFNKRYIDYGNIEQPGRWIKGGVSYRINIR